MRVPGTATTLLALACPLRSDTCREHAIGTTVQRRRWRLISHIATLSFPALTISSPIVLSSDPGFCSFVPRILSSQSYILARPPAAPSYCSSFVSISTSLFGHCVSHVASKENCGRDPPSRRLLHAPRPTEQALSSTQPLSVCYVFLS